MYFSLSKKYADGLTLTSFHLSVSFLLFVTVAQGLYYLAESAGNVASRASYLQKKLANRRSNGLPRRPEVHFMPGSVKFCNSTLKQKEEDDYHGNFVTTQFERWFENLCTTLEQYGRCHIHMDGVSYHKNITNPQPTSSWRRARI
eukprot:jgi/Phyca11/112008/e_gw1.21.562.1